jgi:hypothetical protein
MSKDLMGKAVGLIMAESAKQALIDGPALFKKLAEDVKDSTNDFTSFSTLVARVEYLKLILLHSGFEIFNKSGSEKAEDAYKTFWDEMCLTVSALFVLGNERDNLPKLEKVMPDRVLFKKLQDRLDKMPRENGYKKEVPINSAVGDIEKYISTKRKN